MEMGVGIGYKGIWGIVLDDETVLCLVFSEGFMTVCLATLSEFVN